VLEDFPKANVSVSIVWIDMLPFDNAQAAREAAQMFSDPRVRQFHDPQQLAGRAFAAGLLAPERPAWDIYLFYKRGQAWSDAPPPPVEWMHQLGGRSGADAARRRTGEELVRELHDSMARLTGSRR
jgi:hypothetical protein